MGEAMPGRSLVEGLFSSGVRRDINKGWLFDYFVKPLAALAAVGTVYATTISIVDVFSLTIVMLGVMLALTFFAVGPTSHSDPSKLHALDALFAIMSLATSIYFLMNNDRIITRITLLDSLTGLDIFFGSVLLLLVMEATRRTVGMGLTLIVVIFLAYNLFGDQLSGALSHGVISYRHLIDMVAFTTDGIFGVPIRVALTYVFMFSLFGAFLSRGGGAEFFHDIAAAISGRSPGGPAKVGVVSSGLFGMISGSPTADVVTTGSVTIPVMRRLGYPGTLAGGIEVAACTGGSILPPVMGSAAFIMAEQTGISYQSIVIAAIIPGILYYACLFLHIHLSSLKMGMGGMSEEQIPKMKATLKNGGLFLIPLIVLIGALLLGYSPSYVAAFGTASIIAVMMMRKQTRMGLSAFYDTLVVGTLRIVPVVAACAAAGLVVGGLSMTGLGPKISGMIFTIAGNDLLITLLISAVLTIILGMGMPTPSVYILAAVLIAPAIVSLGASVMSANLFLVYFASLSAMTPPIAVAAFAAAPIAEANPMGIGVAAVRVALAAFFIPFAFVYGEGLLLSGSFWDITVDSITGVLAVGALAIGAAGYLTCPLKWWARLLLISAGLCLFSPYLLVGLGAVCLGAFALIASDIMHKKAGVLEKSGES